MGVQQLLRFIEAEAPQACVPVDLLKIARGVTLRQPRTPSSRYRPPPAVELCLVLDAETCLDRLYGGYFSDWVCGGQWNRMVQFLAILIQTVQANNMELAVFFSGALELPRMREWVTRQYGQRRDINQALKHVAIKGTPPPKVWWTAPACLRTALRMALRHLKVQVLSSMDDHRLEVMAFCRDNNYHGVMAEDAEYIMFGPPRFFSAKQMKLTYKGSLETKEFILNEVARDLDLQPNRFCLLAALFGNFLLTEDDLAEFHASLCCQNGSSAKCDPEDVIRPVVEFVRSLPSVDCLDTVGARVFKSASDPRIQKLKQSVAYYVNGSRDVSVKYKQNSDGVGVGAGGTERPSPDGCSDGPTGRTNGGPGGGADGPAGGTNGPAGGTDGPASGTDGAPSAFASDSETPAVGGPFSQLPPPPSPAAGYQALDGVTRRLGQLSTDDGAAPCSSAPGSYNGVAPPINGHMDMAVEGPLVTLTPPPLPPVTAEVMRTVAERHQKGLMTPWVYQVLTQGELKIPVSMEDELGRELPNSTLFFRPVRERIYAVLFNLYHHNFLHNRDREKPASDRHAVPLVQVREWAYSRNNPYTRPDLVTAKALDWGVPTVQRLWFGTTDDDKKRRLRAFLTCMHSDSPTIRSSVYVPQHLLVLACVLRYIMSQSSATGQSFLFKPELDAFIAQALSPKLTDSHYLQELQLPAVTPRGVQLANLFMQGVETALFANDACGAPIPWLMCCPWLFFDGKLFHSYLLKAAQCRNVSQLCDGQMEMVAQLELMRQAVLDGLHVQYGRPPLSSGPPPEPAAFDRRGGRLEIGGVVVGSWAGSAGLGRGAALLPAGFQRRTIGRTGHPQVPAGRTYAPSGKGGRKQPQGKRKPSGRVDDDPLVPAGRAMTVDTSSSREVGDLSAAGGAGGDTAGQFEDSPLTLARAGL